LYFSVPYITKYVKKDIRFLFHSEAIYCESWSLELLKIEIKIGYIKKYYYF